MKVAELKRLYKEADPGGNYFSPNMMKHFGDTSRNYGVRSKVLTPGGEPVWELYRRKPVNNGRAYSVFFSKEGKYMCADVPGLPPATD
jgi:hypothetical protein